MANFNKFGTQRTGETIGGGYLILRRGKTSGRVRMSFKPFEHATVEAAMAEADRLAKLHPGERFDVFEKCYWAQEAASVPVEAA